MSNHLITIDALLRESREYMALEERAAQQQTAYRVAANHQERHELMLEIDRTRRHKMRFELMHRMYYPSIPETAPDEWMRLETAREHYETRIQQEGRRPMILLDYAWMLRMHGETEMSNQLFDEVAGNLADVVASNQADVVEAGLRDGAGSNQVDEHVGNLADGLVADLGSNPDRAAVDACILDELAAAMGRRGDTTTAKLLEARSVSLFEKLAMARSEDFLPGLALSLHNLGTLHRNDEDYPPAETAYNRAIEIRRKLAQAYPLPYEPLLGLTIRSLARLYSRKDDKERLINTLSYAATIYERLAADAPTYYEPELSGTYRGLGRTYFQINDNRGALNTWEKALSLQERLTETDPARYESELIKTIFGLASTYERMHENTKAERMFAKALATKEKYKSENEATYTPDMARLMRYFGKFYVMTNEPAEAEKRLLAALPLYDELMAREPDNYRGPQEKVLQMLDDIYTTRGGPEPGIDIMEKQLVVYRRMVAIDHELYTGKLAQLLTALASEYADDNRLADAWTLRQEATVLLEGLTNEGDHDWLPLMAENFFWMAILAEKPEWSGHADPEDLYQRSIALYESLAEQDPETFGARLANALTYYAKLLETTGRTEAARQMRERGRRADTGRAVTGDH